MAPSRDRLVLGFLSILLLIFATYLLSRLSFIPNHSSASYNNLFATTMQCFNVVILFGWMASGAVLGIPLTIASLMIGLWAILRAGIYEYSAFTISFIFTGLLGYSYSVIKNEFDRSADLKSENLDEEINVLFNSINEKEGIIKSLEDKLKRYLILKDITEELSMTLSMDEVNKLIIERSSQALGKEGRALLFLVDAERQELMLSASTDASRVKTKKGDAFDHWVLRHRKSLMIDDITRDFRFPADEVQEEKKKFISLIATPLVSENKVIGILRMDSLQDSIYTQDDLRLLDIISDLGAVAIQNTLLYSKTQELAIKDGLTGLFVRRYFMERFHEEITRAARTRGTFSLLIFDIDHFKDYNDRFGHTAGDLVLKNLSRTISSMSREVDILARYGGEEIILLLIGIDKDTAAKNAELIRKRIEERPLMLRRRECCVTVSVGISNYPADAIFEEELIRAADERLYKAKSHGRNRVCVD